MSETEISRALLMLGLCKKAGRLISGVPLVCDAFKEGKTSLAVYAARSSENSVKRITDKAKTYGISVLALDVTPERLGKAVGKSGAVAAVGVTDAGFARAIEKIAEAKETK